MNNGSNNPHNDRFSLTGNEFLDYLSWCDVMGVNMDGTPKEEPVEEIKEENNEEDSQYKSLRKKGRDIYE